LECTNKILSTGVHGVIVTIFVIFTIRLLSLLSPFLLAPFRGVNSHAQRLPIGNGQVLVNFDKEYNSETYISTCWAGNQTIGHVSQFGVWADGKFAWVGSGWNIQRHYSKESNVTDVRLHNEELKLEIQMHDLVDYYYNIFMREIHVKDLSGKARDVRLFFHHDFHISETEVGDTAYYDPKVKGVIQYKKQRWFLMNGATAAGIGINQWSTGNKEVNGAEGTWRDAEDGVLGKNGIAQGSVDSTIGINLKVPANSTEVAHAWVCFGTNYAQVTELNDYVKQQGADFFVPRNQNYWRLWVNPIHIDFLNLPQKIVDLFKRSLLVISTQIDADGAIIAANDHDIAQFARDTYSYMWPRDGALVANALSRAGYRDTVEKFFTFCSEVITKDGYYFISTIQISHWHRAGTPGTRWRARSADSRRRNCFSTLVSLEHFKRNRNVTYMKPLFQGMITNAADFLVRFRDPVTKLPLPSYDLWEERYGVHLFTVSSVIAGLRAAANFAHTLGDLQKHRLYEETADEVLEAMCKHLWSEKDSRFCRMATRTPEGYKLDMTVDAAMYSCFAFAGMPTHDSK